jgi:membrane associated rhomboid family serine protease
MEPVPIGNVLVYGVHSPCQTIAQGRMTHDPHESDYKNQQFRGLINLPPAVVAMLGVLVGIHVALWLLGPVWQTWSVYALSFIPVRLGGGPVIPRPYGSEIWTFFTYALLHADKFHLLSNCLWLLVFSTPVARRLGAGRYLALLAITAAAGAVAILAAHWGKFVITIGASASVAGTMAAAVPIIFSNGFGPHLQSPEDFARLRPLSIGQMLKSPRALFFTAMFLGLQLFTGVSQTMTGTAFLEERNIAWEAHLGGFIAGLLMFHLLDPKRLAKSQRH